MTTMAGVAKRQRLAGTGELMAMLGVSRTRVNYLMAQPGAPEPVDELHMGKIWDWNEVWSYFAAAGRQLHDPEAAGQ